MVTPENAKQLVQEYLEGAWGPAYGTLHVGPVHADETGYLVVWGAREWLVDGNSDYELIDQPVIFVDRATGEITEKNLFSAWDRIDRMREVAS